MGEIIGILLFGGILCAAVFLMVTIKKSRSDGWMMQRKTIWNHWNLKQTALSRQKKAS